MASGKSTVALAVANMAGVPVLSFGGLVRQEAGRRGIAPERRNLQDLGQRLFSDLGPRGMCEALLGQSADPYVIEGVRHLAVYEALVDLLPGVFLVYLTAPAEHLDARWSSRGDGGERPSATSHLVESELAQLQAAAAVSIDTSQVSSPSAARALFELARDL